MNILIIFTVSLILSYIIFNIKHYYEYKKSYKLYNNMYKQFCRQQSDEQLLNNYKLILELLSTKQQNKFNELITKYSTIEPYRIKQSRSSYKNFRNQRKLSFNVYCFVLYLLGRYSFQTFRY